ncbi:MAG TPA: PhzF family phenazine biosynthesis protein [Steroidobacteraceae bacterium]|nr:PhzF family phenazine biosynthesis protein [Steroidobacteraceae bacterium]
MHLTYRLVNVFTQNGGKLTGNPLCVFEDARGLSDLQMQALALQFNLSETTFIFPSDKADARVRIFTPNYEMPFAGHPTLGTAHVVRSLKNKFDSITLELNVGVIPVVARDDQWELRANKPTTRMAKASASDFAAALGINAVDIKGPIMWVNAGTEQLIIPLESEDAVRRVQVSVVALKQVTRDGARAQAYVFAATSPDALLSRFFFAKGDSIAEDPATGSATANLGGWYLANNVSLPMIKTISQGELAGRPSTLTLRIDAERNVFVAGEVIDLGGGYVEL